MLWSTPNVRNRCVNDKSVKMLKRESSSFNGGSKGTMAHCCPHNLVGRWDISLAVKPDIVGVAGYQHAVGSFCLPQLLSKKRVSTAFELVLRSGWRLVSLSKQVARFSTPYRKRCQVWDAEHELEMVKNQLRVQMDVVTNLPCQHPFAGYSQAYFSAGDKGLPLQKISFFFHSHPYNS